MPPRDNETNQESDCEGLKGRFVRQARQTIGGNTGPATRLDGIGDTPACCLNGFRSFLNSFRSLSQQGWRISG
jgi:hypothetical protein